MLDNNVVIMMVEEFLEIFFYILGVKDKDVVEFGVGIG